LKLKKEDQQWFIEQCLREGQGHTCHMSPLVLKMKHFKSA
jgi:hypothetical protein